MTALSVIQSPDTLDHKFRSLVVGISDAFPERYDVIRSLVTALLARQHVLLLGPPGTAKSALANALAGALGARSFAYLMARSTEPAELFGSVDVKMLSDTGRMKLVTSGRIAEADIAFLDEVFKSNSVALNSLLTLINERKFFDDGAWRAAPLRFVVAASNETPDADDASVSAFYDRFLVRHFVDYIVDDDAFTAMALDKLPSAPVNVISLDQLDDAQQQVASFVTVGRDVIDVLRTILDAARAAGMPVSDRRAKQAVAYMRASAWLDGRGSVDVELDMGDLAHMLWSTVDMRERAATIVRDSIPTESKRAREINAQIDALDEAVRVIASLTDKTARFARVGDVLQSKADLLGEVMKMRTSSTTSALIERLANLDTRATNAAMGRL